MFFDIKKEKWDLSKDFLWPNRGAFIDLLVGCVSNKKEVCN
jgi:hypothetical protein